MCSGRSDWALPQPGFPIRRSTDQSLVDSSPWLIAATHVLHRHLAPRHPPLALHSLRTLRPRVSTLPSGKGRVATEVVLTIVSKRCSCSLCSSQGPRDARSTSASRRWPRRATPELSSTGRGVAVLRLGRPAPKRSWGRTFTTEQ